MTLFCFNCFFRNFLFVVTPILIGFLACPGDCAIKSDDSDIPLVVIANFGPHTFLNETIIGTKQALTRSGFFEKKNIRYVVMDVGFNVESIDEMMHKIADMNPRIVVALSTPVAQSAKKHLVSMGIPVVFSAVTDPVKVGLIDSHDRSTENITGTSDQQNFLSMIQFSKILFPKSHAIGLILSDTEVDRALDSLIRQAASHEKISVVTQFVDFPEDVDRAVQNFQSQKVDFVFVGISGTILKLMPIISEQMKNASLPLINMDENAVHKHQVLMSYTVSYRQVGLNTGIIVSEILQGKPVETIPPIYPTSSQHHIFLSQKMMDLFGIMLPHGIKSDDQEIKIIPGRVYQ